MTLLEEMAPAVEVYSIDECFADLTGVPGDLVRVGREMRARVLRCTGIPVGVGIGTSKTLAKLANHGAKKWQAQTGGVLDIRDPARRDRLLQACEVGDVWGIGRRMTEHLSTMGIRTAWDLAQADAWTLRTKFNVVIEKTARELRGTPCLELEDAAPPKQEICCSRMFGKRLHDLPPIRKDIAAETGMEHRPVADGQRVSGIYRRSVMLASGRYAMLDDGMGFSLVPWRPVIEQRLGQQLAATVRGSGVSWEIGRQRGPAIG